MKYALRARLWPDQFAIGDKPAKTAKAEKTIPEKESDVVAETEKKIVPVVAVKKAPAKKRNRKKSSDSPAPKKKPVKVSAVKKKPAPKKK